MRRGSLQDLVTTDGTGEVQLLFIDDTRMVIGANASLVIDEFAFRGDKSENSFSVRALGGAFRFIGGDRGKTDYSIRTPMATIGVRGTAFDFTVSTLATQLMLFEGVAMLRDALGDCALTAERCGILQSTADGLTEADSGQQRTACQPHVLSLFWNCQMSKCWRLAGGASKSALAENEASSGTAHRVSGLPARSCLNGRGGPPRGQFPQ